MHVLEPKELAQRREQRVYTKRRNNRKLSIFLAAVVGIVATAFWLAAGRVKPADQVKTNEQVASITTEPAKPKVKLRTFKGDEFRNLYRSVNYPNTQLFSEPPEITGNKVADARIRTMAEARGFALTSIPVSPIAKTNEPLLKDSGDDLLQPLALIGWQRLKAAAKKDNIMLSLTSAYRSPKWQRDFFLNRLMAHGATVEQMAAGQGDGAISATLLMTAVPGYSRHHTGYTIDMWCEDGSGSFGTSACYEWMNKNNYEHAKEHGWIPSYPEDASIQGPEPEPWEYVWVGTDILYE